MMYYGDIISQCITADVTEILQVMIGDVFDIFVVHIHHQRDIFGVKLIDYT